MKSIDQHMAIYAAYHRNPVNKLTHYIGVPMIIYSLMLLFSMIGCAYAEFEITLAMLITFCLVIYYIILDRAIGFAVLMVFAGLLYSANQISMSWPRMHILYLFLTTFVGGWILQLYGHKIEGRKPALTNNLFQALIAPVFLTAEIFFTLGLKRPLALKVNELSSKIIL